MPTSPADPATPPNGPDLKGLLERELAHYDRFLLHLKFLIREAPELTQKELFAHLLEEEEEHFDEFKELCRAAGVDVGVVLTPQRSINDIIAELPTGAQPEWAASATSASAPPAQEGPYARHHRARDLRRLTVGSLIRR
jgi:hypothetical protein